MAWRRFSPACARQAGGPPRRAVCCTVYRNLDELVRLGVVDRTYLGGGPAAYHLASAAHGHIVCEQCGAMTEVPDELFDDLAQVVAARYGFAIAPHRFAVTGLCANCQ
jgi:Fur family transcriptional regulator, ferric uptake regulator